MLNVAIFLVMGTVLLIGGADVLVRGAARLAERVGLSPLIIGLTVVAFGTSAPELAVSVKAGLGGQADIALGNVVGSNLFNVLFILGASALVQPLLVSRQLIRLDVPLMIGVSALSWLMAADGRIGRFEGLLLFGGIVAYTAFLVWHGRRESAALAAQTDAESPRPTPGAGLALNLFYVVAGLGLLVLGARWLVWGAVELARAFGVSEFFIGVTIVAAGTSLPEAATSIIAALRGERDIAVGNVVGSNIFNLLCVLGAAAAVSGSVGVTASAFRFDLPAMVAVALLCAPVAVTGGIISRAEGAFFLALYAGYVACLVASEHSPALQPTLGDIMTWAILPAAALAAAATWLNAWRKSAPRPADPAGN